MCCFLVYGYAALVSTHARAHIHMLTDGNMITYMYLYVWECVRVYGNLALIYMYMYIYHVCIYIMYVYIHIYISYIHREGN